MILAGVATLHTVLHCCNSAYRASLLHHAHSDTEKPITKEAQGSITYYSWAAEVLNFLHDFEFSMFSNQRLLSVAHTIAIV